MLLTLIRHGETQCTKQRLYSGTSDVPLILSSISTLLQCRGKSIYPSAERYYTSGMRRTEQTLWAIYGSVEHEKISDLSEMNFGKFEGKSYAMLKTDPDYIRWITGDNEKNVCPGGESGEQVTCRSMAVLKKIIATNIDSVVVTHGGIIGGAMNCFFPDRNGRFAYTPKPGSGFTIEFADRKPVRYRQVPVGDSDWVSAESASE